jgi:cytochrome c oxidase subunit 2
LTASWHRLLLPVPGLVDTRHQYYRLFDVFVPIAAGVFALIALVTLFALVRFRARAPERAARWHENNPVEASYALLLTAVAAFLLYLTFSSEHKIDTVASQERPGLTVNVVGSKWEWSFFYPAYHFAQRSGTVGRQPLVVPTNEAIRFNLTSSDVIHTFYVPQLEFKHDVFPGIIQRTTLTFTRAGTFWGQCSQFCGLRHADMVFPVVAVSPARFTAWARAGGKSAP